MFWLWNINSASTVTMSARLVPARVYCRVAPTNQPSHAIVVSDTRVDMGPFSYQGEFDKVSTEINNILQFNKS